MKLRNDIDCVLGAVLTIVLTCVGCQPAAPAVSDKPMPPASLVAQLTTLHDTIEQGVQSDDLEAIHDPLHQVMETLRSLATVEDASLSAASLDELHAAAETLAAEYGKLDAAMHGNKEFDYADIEAQVNAELEKLRLQVSMP